MSRKRLGILAILVAAGCRYFTEPQLPAGAQLFTPPAVYETWWELVESCAQAEAPIDDVSFYVVPGASTITVRGRRALGYWSAESNRIVLAETAQLDGPAVRHEMLHAILETPAHSRLRFLEQCGGVVLCSVDCLADVAPAPPVNPSVPQVLPGELVVETTVSPASPGLKTDGGFFRMTVTATSTAAHPVTVALPTSDGAGPPRTFSYAVWGPEGGTSGGVSGGDPSAWQFAAGESKSHIFDFRIGEDRGSLSPGEHSFHGSYGGKTGKPVSAVLQP